jgi:hypothetical protein
MSGFPGRVSSEVAAERRGWLVRVVAAGIGVSVTS